MKVAPELPEGPNIINRFEGEYRFLSNFYPVSVRYKSEMYPSVEHAYQAAKFHTVHLRAQIGNADTPADAKRKAKELAAYCRDDWEKAKVRVMSALVWLKFRDHLRNRLAATGSKLLIEGNDWGDKFWGVANGEGENWLGRILMNVRLRNRYEAWAAETNRFPADQLKFNPWNEHYAVRSVERDWDAFLQGFAHGHETDYRRFQ